MIKNKSFKMNTKHICPSCNNYFEINMYERTYSCCDSFVCSYKCSVTRYKYIGKFDPKYKQPELWLTKINSVNDLSSLDNNTSINENNSIICNSNSNNVKEKYLGKICFKLLYSFMNY